MLPLNPPPPLQGPGIPTLSHAVANTPPQPSMSSVSSPPPTLSTASLPSIQLNVNPNAFVPISRASISLRSADGQAVKLENLTKRNTIPSSATAALSPQGSVYRQSSGSLTRRPISIRMETEDQRKKRLAEEEAKGRQRTHSKAEADEKVKLEETPSSATTAFPPQGSVYQRDSPGMPTPRPASTRMETKKQRRKRLVKEMEKEREKTRAKAEAEEKARLEKEEVKRKIKEEEEMKRKEEEEEKGRLRKEEEKERLRKQRLKEEEDRIRREAEEEEAEEEASEANIESVESIWRRPMPMLPRNPPPPLQGPGIPALYRAFPPPLSHPQPSMSSVSSPPPTRSTAPLPSTRLNVNPDALVPTGRANITLRSADGQAVKLENLTNRNTTPSPATAALPPQGSVYQQSSGTPTRRPTSIRMETEDQRRERLADGEREGKDTCQSGG